MKVLMVNSFHYLRGGAERCCFDLSALLEAHGHKVIPFSMRHPRNVPTPYDDYFVSAIDFPTELAKPGLGPKSTSPSASSTRARRGGRSSAWWPTPVPTSSTSTVSSTRCRRRSCRR